MRWLWAALSGLLGELVKAGRLTCERRPNTAKSRMTFRRDSAYRRAAGCCTVVVSPGDRLVPMAADVHRGGS